jgi:hypothetical protein
MKRISPLLMMCLLSSPAPGLAGVIIQTKGSATLTLQFDAPTPKLALADVLTVTLTIEGTASMRTPIAPLELPAAAPWMLVERSGFPRQSIAPARVRYRLTYRFAPREPGAKIPFSFPDIQIRDGANADQTIAWDTIPFEVETQIGQLDRTSLRDITAIEELPPIVSTDRSWQLWFVFGGVGSLLILGIFGLGVLFRRKTTRSPTQLALYELQRLVAMKLPDRARGERFFTLLSMLMRRYLEREFALPARRQTTQEFLRTLDQVSKLCVEEKQFLMRFFGRCDGVKFAQAAIYADECTQWASDTRSFLQLRYAAKSKTPGHAPKT